MKMRLALGSWLRLRLDGRWQWIVLIGILAFFNTAEDVCYSFRIEPSLVNMDAKEDRQLRVRDWTGTLDISHNCNPGLVTVTWNNSTGLIYIATSPKGLWGKCLISAKEIHQNGRIFYANATVEVFKHPMHAHVITGPALGTYDFGNKWTLGLAEQIAVYVEGGVEPYSQISVYGSPILDIKLIDESPHQLSVKALKAGHSTLYIKDGQAPPDVLMLNFEVM